MADKIFKIGSYDSGRNPYAIFYRQSDNFIYDVAPIDNWVAGPSNPFAVMAEPNSFIPGLYTVKILDGTVWEDGVYEVCYYDAINPLAPNPDNDDRIGNQEFEIRNDAILTLNNVAATIADEVFKTLLEPYKDIDGSFGQKMFRHVSDPRREHS